MVIYSGFSHWKWWFSIAMLVYQRVWVVSSAKGALAHFFRYHVLWILQDHSWLVVFNHLEKYESQWEGLSHILWILWKITNVWNHQPGIELRIQLQHFAEWSPDICCLEQVGQRRLQRADLMARQSANLGPNDPVFLTSHDTWWYLLILVYSMVGSSVSRLWTSAWSAGKKIVGEQNLLTKNIINEPTGVLLSWLFNSPQKQKELEYVGIPKRSWLTRFPSWLDDNQPRFSGYRLVIFTHQHINIRNGPRNAVL